MNKTTLCVLALLAGCSLPAAAQIDTTLTRQDAFVRANIAVGANKDFARLEAASRPIAGEAEQSLRMDTLAPAMPALQRGWEFLLRSLSLPSKPIPTLFIL